MKFSRHMNVNHMNNNVNKQQQNKTLFPVDWKVARQKSACIISNK